MYFTLLFRNEYNKYVYRLIENSRHLCIDKNYHLTTVNKHLIMFILCFNIIFLLAILLYKDTKENHDDKSCRKLHCLIRFGCCGGGPKTRHGISWYGSVGPSVVRCSERALLFF